MREDKEIIKQEQEPTKELEQGSDIKISEKTLFSLGQHLSSRFKSLVQLRESSYQEAQWAEALRMYQMQPDPAKIGAFEGAANLPCPLPRIFVDSWHANFMYSIASNGSFRVSPKVMNRGYVEQAERSADFLTYQLNHEIKFYDVLDEAGRQANIYGIAYLEPRYEQEVMWETAKIKETTQVPVLDINEDQPVMEDVTKTRTVKKKNVVFDGVRVECLDIESVYVSPLIKDIQTAVKQDVVFKTFKESVKSIQRKGKDGIYRTDAVDKIKETAKGCLTSNLSDLELQRALVDGVYEDKLANEVVELADAHLWYDVDGDDIDEKVLVTLDPKSGDILRVALAPCRIVDIVIRPVDGRFGGEGIPKIGYPIFTEWEAIHNQRVDAGAWANTPFFLYRAGGRLNFNEIQIRPGHGYPTDDPNSVRFYQQPQVGQSYYNEEQLLFTYAERVFAVTENLQGVASGATTATESLSLTEKSSIRFNNPLHRFLNSLETLVEYIWDLNAEFSPPEKEFYILGAGQSPLFKKMSRIDFVSGLKFKFDISTVFDQQLARDTSLLVYRMMMSNPLTIQHPAVMYDVTTEMLRSLNKDVRIPLPVQKKAKSPYEEHEIMLNSDNLVEPVVGEDVDWHIQTHQAFVGTDEYNEDWTPEQKQKLLMHINKTIILKQTIEKMNLNQSGMYDPGIQGPMTPSQPGMTASRNPSQMFNTMRVMETGNSMMQNNRNGEAGR